MTLLNSRECSQKNTVETANASGLSPKALNRSLAIVPENKVYRGW